MHVILLMLISIMVFICLSGRAAPFFKEKRPNTTRGSRRDLATGLWCALIVLASGALLNRFYSPLDSMAELLVSLTLAMSICAPIIVSAKARRR